MATFNFIPLECFWRLCGQQLVCYWSESRMQCAA